MQDGKPNDKRLEMMKDYNYAVKNIGNVFYKNRIL